MLPLEHNYMFPGGGYQYSHGHILSANLLKLPPSLRQRSSTKKCLTKVNRYQLATVGSTRHTGTHKSLDRQHCTASMDPSEGKVLNKMA